MSDLVERLRAVDHASVEDCFMQSNLLNEAAAEIERLRTALASAEAEGYRRGVEDAAKVAEAQPFYPDTHTGMRQQWVKDQIAAAIRSLTAPDKEGA